MDAGVADAGAAAGAGGAGIGGAAYEACGANCCGPCCDGACCTTTPTSRLNAGDHKITAYMLQWDQQSVVLQHTSFWPAR